MKYLLRIERQWIQHYNEEPMYEEVEANTPKEAVDNWVKKNEEFENEEMQKELLNDIDLLQEGKKVTVYSVPDMYVIEVIELGAK